MLAAVICLTFHGYSQLTVTATVASPTICAGNSTSITATAVPVGYTMSSIANNPEFVFGANLLADAGAAVTTLSTGNLNDGRWDNITLPFTFTYFGNIYNSVCVSTNGWVGLGGTNLVSTGFNVALPNAGNPNNVIHAVTSNLNLTSSGTVQYYASGVTPNQIFIVDYANVPFFSGGGTVSVQIILYEVDNSIEIHTTSCTNTSLGKAQGLENSTGTVAYTATGRNNTTNWSATGMPNAYRFVPDVISFTWSPATGLNTTTGPNVIASPTSNITYTINALNPNGGATGSTTATVNIQAGSYTLAGTAGGAQVCRNAVVSPGGSDFRDPVTCNLVSRVVPAGASPVGNVINNCVLLATGSTKRGTTRLYGPRQYDIEPAINPATSTANVTLYYLQSEFDNYNLKAADSGYKLLPVNSADATGISNLVIHQLHGTGTNPNNYTGGSEYFTTATPGCTVVWNATRSWWEVTVPVTGFSGFYLTSKSNAALPIFLEYFRGVTVDKKNALNWKVNCTSDHAVFEIERSADGTHYSKIGTITATQLRCSDPFDFTDETPFKGNNYYRIRMVDIDGKASFSNTVLLTQKTDRFELTGLNPNPVTSGIARLQVNAREKNELRIVITDFAGRVLSHQTASIQPGSNEISINCSHLAAGTYMVSAQADGEKTQSLRLVKQ